MQQIRQMNLKQILILLQLEQISQLPQRQQQTLLPIMVIRISLLQNLKKKWEKLFLSGLIQLLNQRNGMMEPKQL